MLEIIRTIKNLRLDLWLLLPLCIASFALVLINVYLFAAVFSLLVLGSILFKFYQDNSKVAKEKEEEKEGEPELVRSSNRLLEFDRPIGEPVARRESQEMFRHTAYYDGLTDLPNRNYIIEALKQLLEANTDEPASFAVLCLNLNRFRTINESLGHSTGDRIIRQVAKRICETLSEGDVVGHLGGDEFVLILTKAEDLEAVTLIADTLARRIAESIRFQST